MCLPISMSMLMLIRSSLTIVTICEERERSSTARVEVCLVVGHWVLSGVVSRRSQWSRGRLRSLAWVSSLKLSRSRRSSLLPLSPPTQLSSPHWHCYLARGTLPAQSDNHSWSLITSTHFHRFRVLPPWSYQHLLSRFS